MLAKRQLPVSGSDLRPSHITQRLQSVGAQIFNRQDAKNLAIFQGSTSEESSSPKNSFLREQPQIITSTAISAHNSEYKAAVDLGYPIFHRSDVLAALIQEHKSIAVAGTHGKTTTSSLIGYLLLKAGLDPTIIVGGEVEAWGGNARLGESRFLVAEADESDGSLIKHSPDIGVVTNIELDHPDHYQTLDEVIGIFKTFERQCQIVVASLDCQTIREHLSPTITYSLDPSLGADYTIQNLTHLPEGSLVEVLERGQYLGEMRLHLMGKHNISNALAAVAVGRKLGLDFATIAGAIATFEGAKRRFEHRGQWNGATLIDDYAHHPSEILVTLAAARLRLEQKTHKRVVAIFQPHRYSRTATFLEEFANSFRDADLVVVTDIYSAGEQKIEQITGQRVADCIGQYHPQVYYHPSLTTLGEFLTQNILQPHDLVLFLGAGNLNQIIPTIVSPQTKAA